MVAGGAAARSRGLDPHGSHRHGPGAGVPLVEHRSDRAMMLPLLLAGLLSAEPARAPVSFPVRVHPSGRFLVDASDRPLRTHAGAAWGLGRQLKPDGIERYLQT